MDSFTFSIEEQTFDEKVFKYEIPFASENN
jgi:hypothetical protein